MGILQDLASETGSILGQLLNSYHKARGNKPKHSRVFSAYLTETAQQYRWGGLSGSSGYEAAFQEQAQHRALTNSWVFIAVNFIAKEVSTAELKVTDFKTGEAKEVLNHHFLRVMRKPNPAMGRNFLWQYTAMWLELAGEAYWFLVTDDEGKIVEIWPLPSTSIDPRPGNDEKLIDHYEYNVNGRIYNIPPELIAHFYFPNPWDIFRGLPPLVAGMMSVDTDTAMSIWNTNFFNRDNIMPSSIINIKPDDPSQPIDQADIEELKNDLRDNYAAYRRKSAILSTGTIQVEKLEYSPFEMDFKGSRDFTKKEIYQIFGIPDGMLDSGTLAGNVRVSDMIFREKTIWPILTLLAEQITAQIINVYYSKEMEAEFEDIRPVNRQLELQEMSAAQSVMTIDELRQRFFKLEPLPDARGERLLSETKAAPPATGSSTAPLNGTAKPNGKGPLSNTAKETVDEGAMHSSALGMLLEGQPSLREQGLPRNVPPKPPKPGELE